jgi:nucleolar protein 15
MSKLLHEAANARKRVREETGANAASSQKTKKATPLSTVVTASAKAGAMTAGNTKRKVAKQISSNSKVIYLGHIPTGFAEKEMKAFFKQFGDVDRVKLFRSKKTQSSKGYAFIRFVEDNVSETVAEAMDGYMMHGRQLRCNVVPPSKLHDGMFKTKKPEEEAERIDNDEVDDDQEEGMPNEQALKSYKRSQRKKEEKLKALGIDFDIKDVMQPL